MRPLAIFGALLSGACHVVAPPPSNPPTAPDGGIVPEPLGDAAPTLSGCERAWQRIQTLSCTVSAPRTGSWVEACDNAEQNAIDMHTSCVVAAQNCSDVFTCLGEQR